MTVPLPYGDTESCPVRALERWLVAAGITESRCSGGSGCRPRQVPARGGQPARDGRPSRPSREAAPGDRRQGSAGAAGGRSTGGEPGAATAVAAAAPPLRRIRTAAITPQTVAQIVQARAVAAGFRRRDLGGHSLKRGALTTGMEAGIHRARPKRLGRHKSFDTLSEYLELGNLFDGHPLSGVL